MPALAHFAPSRPASADPQLSNPWFTEAGSQWHVQGRARLADLPPNVLIGSHLAYPDLKRLYGHAAVVAVALQPGAHGSAGGETILEAMAMARAVVVATDNHLSGYVEDRVTGLIVPAGDVGALRAAILELLEDPARAAEMGRQGRAKVERDMPFDARIRSLAALAESNDHGSLTA